MSIGSTFPGFRLRLTRWGAIFLLASLVLGFAAVNTGNNALMALLGLALSSYAVAGLWSRQVLGGIELVLRGAPRDIYAGRPAVVDVEIVNRSRLFPAYGLVVRDGGGRWLLEEPLIAARGRVRRGVEIEFAERGWAELGPWSVDVVLPLGFFVKSKRLRIGERLLVYPRVLPRSRAEPQGGGGSRAAESFHQRGREGEVVQLREYRDGDDTRQVHWKQTARQQRPIVVDRQRRSAMPVFFIVDPRVSDPDDPAVRVRFESMVSEAATAVVGRVERGLPAGLVVGGAVVQPVRSGGRIGHLLRPLAEVQPQRMDSPPPAAVGNADRWLFQTEPEP